MAAGYLLDEDTATLVGVTREVMRKEGLPDGALLLRAGDEATDPDRAERLRRVGLCRQLVEGEAGGMGLGVRAAVAIVEALGRAFVPEPVVAENLAAHALARAGVEVPDGPLAWAGVVDRAARGVVVPGAQLIVGVAGGEVVALAVAGRSAHVVDDRDPARPIADWAVRPAEASMRGAADASSLLDIASVLLAAEAVGAMGLAVERTVNYAKEREQFGRPIGAFQAVKHRLADMWAATELARAAVEQAALDLDDGVPAPPSVGAACAVIVESFLDVAASSVHLHGAMGYAWESGCHLFVRRALGTAALLGDPSDHRRRALAAFRPAEPAHEELVR